MLSKNEISRYWVVNRPRLFFKFFKGTEPTYNCWSCCIESSSLQRCHIIPKSKGGTLNANNFVLLCSDCHHEAPSFYKKRSMFEWLLNRQPRELKIWFEIKKVIDANELKVKGLNKKLLIDCFLKELGKTEKHNGINSLSTISACLKNTIRKQKVY